MGGEVGTNPLRNQQELLERAKQQQADTKNQPTEAPPRPGDSSETQVKKKDSSILETQAPGQGDKKTQAGSTSLKQGIAMPSPESSKAWGAMGATALGSSGPKAIPGTENVIDTQEEREQQQLKRQVAELGIKSALERNGAPADKLDESAKKILDTLFSGKGDKTGGSIGFTLAKDGALLQTDANGKQYYEFGIGGEGSSLDLNGDGKNDNSRQYFKVFKDQLNANNTPVVAPKGGSKTAPLSEGQPVKESNPTKPYEIDPKILEDKDRVSLVKDFRANEAQILALENGQRFTSPDTNYDYFKIANSVYYDTKKNGIAGKLDDDASSHIYLTGEDGKYQVFDHSKLSRIGYGWGSNNTYGYKTEDGRLITHDGNDAYKLAAESTGKYEGAFELTDNMGINTRNFAYGPDGELSVLNYDEKKGEYTWGETSASDPLGLQAREYGSKFDKESGVKFFFDAGKLQAMTFKANRFSKNVNAFKRVSN